jgi:hypothetical protein
MAEFRSASELTLTILTGEPMLTKVLNELESMPKSMAERIKYVLDLAHVLLLTVIVSVIDIGAPATLLEPQVGFNPVFADLWVGKPVVKVGSSESLVLPKPSVVILDVRQVSYRSSSWFL